jgi:hypothetical protein
MSHHESSARRVSIPGVSIRLLSKPGDNHTNSTLSVLILYDFPNANKRKTQLGNGCQSEYGKYVVPGKAKPNDLGCLLVLQMV